MASWRQCEGAASRIVDRAADRPSCAPDTGGGHGSTVRGLTRTRAAGVRLVILSNTDRDLISHSLRHLRVPFDDVITAEDCGTYKPDPEFFRQALERIGVTPERIRHVAFGFKYDNAPAKRFGMRTAWINRHDEPQQAGEPADHTWRDLWGLAGLADGWPVPD
ncbi:MAG: HAD-IA family hydrolase [Saccharopolyspora sp.]|nr:HAD-IA family hydrolase [Saccharopolyspora sp.]